MRTGGQLIVDALEANGVERIYSVPGESYLAVLDALHDSKIENVVCRQEGGAAMMADCEGRLTGKPGICFVTRGPGATNASAGIHIAQQDSNPMILFVGQIARGIKEREAFQEVDYKAFYGSMAKWVVEIDDAARIPELVTRAFAVATSGRPGPVVISLPEDMLRDEVEAPKPLPYTPVETRPGQPEMDRLVELLEGAERPFLVLGGTRWTEEAVKQICAGISKWKLPVGCSFRRQTLCDQLHDCYAGDIGIGANPKLAGYIKDADVVLLIGCRFGEMPSADYTLLKSPYPDQKLVHVFPDPEELGRVFRPELAINASNTAFAEAFSRTGPSATPAWANRTEELHQSYLDWSTPPTDGPGAVKMGPVMAWLEENLPEDVIVANGAGNFATWMHRFHRYRRFNGQAAPTSGSMGYGVPAGVAAKGLFPEREVLVWAGDGDFQMHGQEFATAIQYDRPIIVVILNNGIYGTIRMHQERDYPGRVSGTTMKNPDFAALARAYGGHGEIVAKTEEFGPAYERARASGTSAIIEVRLDPEAITPTKTLTQIREGK
ncbi:thiamine pyrophosphate-binding protein [Aliihoeflea sp. 2WW]|uniref:thiamine pyrophosphate-binding protein n=1 Tax=Aliihoeflea sp. 2WW TaxID=1381123 RepID=UPI0004635A18|nr:thiamine pyrophosphate-binding protein [Aliihoeflea sp. 2WW]